MGELTKRHKLLTFDELMAEVVDEVLKLTFTERYAYFVWTYLETASIERLEIARKPEAFEACLKTLFGSAAQTLERLILKRLCQILNVKFKEGYTFSDYIEELRKIYVKLELTRYKQYMK
ncbi:MAG: hypothetical protein QXV21_04785 [Candidatus Bathyarchaeia archaeon]